jgi:hypothetical protein
MWYVRCGVLVLAACGLSAGAEARLRPACTEDRAGRMWPDEANDNPKFATALMPYGFPQVCTFRDGRYEWRSFTVSLKQLRKGAVSKKRRLNSGATSGR